MTPPAAPDVLIVGTGFSGLCMAIRLKEAGFDDFVILEKAADVGGTWRENTYPGCGCDVMSLMYSFSFAPNRRWTRMYARQPEILDYIRRVVDDYDLARYIRFDSEVAGYDFDQTADRWTVRTASGDVYRPRIVIAGPGPLHKPHIPTLSGRERFAGKMFHSAEWDHDVDLAGKRVAVIGTGASAVQFVPEVAKQAAHLDVFQRTAHWILPKLDRPITPTEKRLFDAVPGARKAYRGAIYWTHESLIAGFMHPRLMAGLERAARGLLRRQVPDRRLRATLTPDYTIGCKRILVSSNYYPTLQRENVDLVTSGIAEFTASGIRTVDGVEHPADVVVFGTGFEIGERFEHEHIVGRGGQTIQQAWRDGMEGYLGVAVTGFPNFFLMMGPNSGGGNQSIVFVIEAQAHYILECLRAMADRDATRIEVRAGTQHDFNRQVHRKLEGSVWNSGGCDSWYLDRTGRNRAAWPGSSVSYWMRTRHPDLGAFDLSSASDRDEEDYRGPAVLEGAGLALDVAVHLTGHMDPIDGNYHWYGQIRGDDRVAQLKRPDAGTPTLRIGDGPTVDASLTERDPWGHFRVTGVGAPPFALDDLVV
ncbi:cation diffusion facilitator CzcD-associated flavoprotein CzcO [Rhodococcus sp. OK519]|uniref:DUF4873 domain-containing protein n=1 Tax=Rhodococcus sp. OK519 TaxID=2135729 RepID=UPI000D37E644|nr:cation diffusion facilitator CzcD-associated flavoprotein CzcO [Rhodococcus sp. OK519]